MTRAETRVLADVSAEDVLASHFTLAALPGAIEPMSVPGIEGWSSPNPHPVLSLMRWTTTDPEEAAETLDTVLELFRDKGHGFDWMTGPDTAHLVPLLYERGFIDPPLIVAAMSASLSQDITACHDDGVQIRRVADSADTRICDIMARGFDVPDDVGRIFHAAYLTPSPLQSSEVYAVSVDGKDEPVGVGYLSYIGDGSFALLRVSSVLADHRGRGLYQALVRHRMAQAAKNGCTHMFVHAYSDESKRALESQGFDTLGTLQLHRWRV